MLASRLDAGFLYENLPKGNLDFILDWRAHGARVLVAASSRVLAKAVGSSIQ